MYRSLIAILAVLIFPLLIAGKFVRRRPFDVLYIRTDRIGHQVMALGFSMMDSGPQVVVTDRIAANKFLKRVLKDNFLVLPWGWLLRDIASVHWLKNYIRVQSTRSPDRDINMEFSDHNFDKAFFFNEKLDQRMDFLGLTKNKFVCLVVRDSSYLNKRDGNVDYSYHSYRNSSIFDYEMAIRKLISCGFCVVRLGKEFESSLRLDIEGYYELSTIYGYSDDWDVWCAKNCQGFISSGTGPDCLALIFDKPVLFVNFLPVYGLWSYHNILAFPKYLRDENSETLRLDEQIKASFLKTSDFDSMNIKVEDLSREDLCVAVEEFVERKLRTSDHSNNLDQKIWRRFLELEPIEGWHQTIHPRASFCKGFLSNVKL